MKSLSKAQTNTSILFGVLALAVVTIAPHAFAQESNPAGQGQQNGIPLGGNYGVSTQQVSVDQGSAMGWSVGMASAAVATGVGMWSIVKRR